MSKDKKVAAALALAALLIAIGGAGTFSIGLDLLGCYQSIPFLLGGEIACPPMLGTWAFNSPCDVPSLPLYFNAHGFGFPMTIGNFRIGLVPSVY